MPAVWHLRVLLYSWLWLVSAVLLGLTAWRLYYTTHIPLGDPLHDGVDFYDPIVAELLATSILTLLWSAYIIHVISGVYERRLISRFRGELIGLLILFVLWLVGAAIATTYWGNLSWCWVYRPCRVLTALVAFAWIGWASIFIIFVYTLLFVLSNRVVMEPLHARWNPRVSVFGRRA
ncbi:hypothetical protein GLOTRDRAFT_138422 [Gloeophyllum trabeum ATCC 11539]|uniref:MARVEL domain-containing protein n=1 Tax=Gloeophyllum trabeum (strain ATCC 11539 / FP-39264 / Madison 617) TaxID=670483 RepID=S7Q654_GLOTA|nr:uncharacterized protein GLOTRDRAFT_138422 [Gloeophyllum trabeum ATCC 11539]EPQ55516.1 hypothetical protein GLOTRDRAFT_138422 [Gloeophyllum trabeum ATCC 11539]